MVIQIFRSASRLAAFCLVLALGCPTANFCRAADGVPPIELHVDATRLHRNLLVSELVIPCEPGKLALWHPMWIPGIHGPGEQIRNIGGLQVTDTQGNALSWRRDPENLYRFLVDVPQECHQMVVRLTYIANQPTRTSRGVDSYGNVSLAVVNFNTCLLYPETVEPANLAYQVHLRLPKGWQYGTALPLEKKDQQTLHFRTTSLRELIDSPLVAGEFYRKLTVTAADFPPVDMHFVSESPEALEFDQEQADRYRELVQQAGKLFGGAPFARYDFLVVCSDRLPPTGLEHLASSLNVIDERALVDPDKRKGWSAGLLPHEFVHAWCGKYRRPAGMDRLDYHSAKDTSLLWVYEGLTQYLGHILTVRSGLLSVDDEKELLAARVASLRNRTGRQWRSLEDTALSGHTLRGGSKYWNDLRRNQDYYNEGALFWLEADVRMRRISAGKVALDDFCRRFFHADAAQPGRHAAIRPFTLDELLADLEAVQPFDWRGLVRRRITQPQEELSLEPLLLAGYELAFVPEMPQSLTRYEKDRKMVVEDQTLGLRIDKEQVIAHLTPGGPADKAGLWEGLALQGINERKYTAERLRWTLKHPAADGMWQLLTLDGDRFRRFTLRYSDGPRYPALRRLDGQADRLATILQPR